jgi:hypothetical protein
VLGWLLHSRGWADCVKHYEARYARELQAGREREARERGNEITRRAERRGISLAGAGKAGW